MHMYNTIVYTIYMHTLMIKQLFYLLCNSFGKIFDSFCLSCPCRPLRGSPQVKVESSKQCSVAAIGERSDDKARRVAKVLITIGQC